jgi:methyl-accepting chemotaxis protein
MTANLADRGLTAAKGAVAGKTGFTNDPHYRNGILRKTGYTHLKGALGYPGMNWSVLVSVNHAGATADARAINRNVLIAIIVCLAIVLPIGIIIGRIGARGIGRVSEAAAKLAGGAFDTRVSVTTSDEIGVLAQSFNEMGAQIQEKMTKEREQAAKMETFMVDAKRVLGNLAQGDLRDQMTSACDGDLSQIKDSLNTAITNLTTTLTTVREAAGSVTSGAEEITKGSEDLSQRTSEQASSLEETSSAMEEMTSTVKQNADNAKQANQLAIAAREVAGKGGAITTKAVEAMEEINKSSKKIAVVAAEVRNLAQRSATAAKEIKGLINESIQRVTDGSTLVDQSGKTLGEIISSVKRVTDIIAEISAASQEQANGIDQVNKAIMQMDESTQQNAALVEETTSASQSMKDQARELMRQVDVFKTSRTSDVSHMKREAPDAGTKYAARTTFHAISKPMTKKSLGGAKPAEDKVPAAPGYGKDHRSKETEFEEF